MITKKQYGRTAAGAAVEEYTLTNARGEYVKVITYGAIITELWVRDAAGRLTDTVLGFDNLEAYETQNAPHFGAAIGRLANRVDGASFTLNGKTYTLAANVAPHSLHSGPDGYHKRVWDAAVYDDELELTLHSPHGDQGFPGNLTVRCTLSFSDDAALSIRWHAAADADTPLNLTNHSYFNLNGTGDILKHTLTLKSAYTVETDKDSIPTGRLLAVAGTAFDFNTPHTIGERIGEAHPQLVSAKGYDHNYCLEQDGTCRLFAEAEGDVSGIVLRAYTDLEGVQLYVGNYLKGERGKRGAAYNHRGGFCLETQHFPDAVHQKTFPTCILKAGGTFESVTKYCFSVKGA